MRHLSKSKLKKSIYIFGIGLTIFIVETQANKNKNESQCYGTTSKGRLLAGVKLPSVGKNFESYSLTAELAGRTYVHSRVRKIILVSYKWLELNLPKKVFKYGETGLKNGGPFPPHKTHQNGLSIDFMVPVIDKKGRSVFLPTHYLNRLGYDIEFDSVGSFNNYKIDFEAMAAHIVSLHKAALNQNSQIWRVIFDPKLQPYLFKTSYAGYLKEHINFSKKRSWVRHDEHYHIDFIIPCGKLN